MVEVKRLIFLGILLFFILYSGCLPKREPSIIIIPGSSGSSTSRETQSKPSSSQDGSSSVPRADILDISSYNSCESIATLKLDNQLISIFNECKSDNVYLLIDNADNVVCVLGKKINNKVEISKLRLVKFNVLNNNIYSQEVYVPESNLKNRKKIDVTSDSCLEKVSTYIRQNLAINEIFKVLVSLNNYFYLQKEKIRVCYKKESLEMMKELLSFVDPSLKSLETQFERKCENGENEKNIFEIINQVINSKDLNSKEHSFICFNGNIIDDLTSLSTIFGKYFWYYEPNKCANRLKYVIIDNKNKLEVRLLKDLTISFSFYLNYSDVMVNEKINDTLIESLLNFSFHLNAFSKDESKNEEILRYLRLVKNKIKPQVEIIPLTADNTLNEFLINNFFNETFLSLENLVFPSIINLLYYPLSQKETLSNAISFLNEIVLKNRDIRCSLDNDICNKINNNKMFFKNYSSLIEYLSSNKKMNPYLLYSTLFVHEKNLNICKKSENIVDDFLNIYSNENPLQFIHNKFDQKCLGLIVVYSWFFNYSYSRQTYDFKRIENKDVNVKYVEYRITPLITQELFRFCDEEILLKSDEDVNNITILSKSEEGEEEIINRDKRLEKEVIFDKGSNRINITYDSEKKIIKIECNKRISSNLFETKSEIIEELIVRYVSSKVYNIAHMKFNFSLSSLSLQGKAEEKVTIVDYEEYNYSFKIVGFGNNVKSLQNALEVFEQIKFNEENVKEKLKQTNFITYESLSLMAQFENGELIFNVTYKPKSKSSTEQKASQTISFICKNRRVCNNLVVKREISIDQVSYIIEGKLLTYLRKLNSRGISRNSWLEIRLRNMNVTLTVGGKSFNGVTDDEGKFRILIKDSKINLQNENVSVSFFYERRFPNFGKVKLKFFPQEANYFNRIYNDLLNESKSKDIIFKRNFENFCNNANNDDYSCEGNKIIFNFNITPDKVSRYNFTLDKSDIEYYFYTYYFLEEVIDFYLQFNNLRNVMYPNLIIYIAPRIRSNTVAGIFSSRILNTLSIIGILNISYSEMHKYLFSVLVHEYTHYIISLRHLNPLWSDVNYYGGYVIIRNFKDQQSSSCDVSYEIVSINNYGGIRNVNTIDSMNEGLAKIMEKVFWEEYYRKKKNSIYEEDIDYISLTGFNLELNSNPYESSIAGRKETSSEIDAIVSFVNDLLDNTPNERILRSSFINEIGNNLKINVDPSFEIYDEVYINYIDFVENILLKDYNRFTFYEFYQNIKSTYPHLQEQIENVALRNLLYYINRTGSYLINISYTKNDCEITIHSISSCSQFAENFKEGIYPIKEFWNKFQSLSSHYKFSLSSGERCNKESKSLNISLPCQIYNNRSCIYELYTFIYNKSQQGEVGIVSFEGHYVKDLRRKEIKDNEYSHILIKEPFTNEYIVEVRFLEDYGIDNYSYIQRLDDENKLYIHPIPDAYLAEIRIRPYLEESGSSVKQEYIITSREMNEKIANSDKNYFDEVKFELVSKDKPLENYTLEDYSQDYEENYKNERVLMKLLIVTIVIFFSLFVYFYVQSKEAQRKNKKI